jgi:hypothetical protein
MSYANQLALPILRERQSTLRLHGVDLRCKTRLREKMHMLGVRDAEGFECGQLVLEAWEFRCDASGSHFQRVGVTLPEE